MPDSRLADLYRKYIHCLNTQDWEDLGRYVSADVAYNGQTVGLKGYREARENEFRDIPDLHFSIQILTADDKTVASRLNFSISPRGEFLGLPVKGRRITFAENVFYEFENDRIARVWSVLDKAAIEAQLSET
jgi:predicted ester cyclase